MDVTRVTTAHKALVCAAGLALSLGMATVAQAATVAPMTGYGLLTEETGVDVLRVFGSAGETVYLDVYRDGSPVAKGYPWTLQEDGEGSLADVLVLGGIDLSSLDAYSVEAFADSQCSVSLGSYHLLPVYATLIEADGSSTVKLIGCTTESVASAAPAVIATIADGQKYTRVSDDGASLQYMNMDGVEAQGTIEYVLIDTETGERTVVARENVDIPAGQTVYWPIEDVIEVEYEGGKVSYETHCNRNSAALSAQNPSFTVPVTSAFGAYTASISFVDESSGNVIMTDQVRVNRQNIYTAPRTFYRTDPETGLVTTYNMVSDNVVTMDPSSQVTSYTVSYAAEQPGDPVTWTIVLMNGVTGTEIDRIAQSILPDQTATFEASPIVVEGKTLVPFGETTYSYTYNQGEPLQYVYFVEEGYEPLEEYQVTVQYVDISTGSVLSSWNAGVSPSMTSDLVIEPGPGTIDVGGSKYVLLNGQTMPYTHSYYTANRTYTFYYRNVADTAYESTTIVRTVVVDNGTTPSQPSSQASQGGYTSQTGAAVGSQTSGAAATASSAGLTVVTGSGQGDDTSRGSVSTVGASGLGVVVGPTVSGGTSQSAVVTGGASGVSTVSGSQQAAGVQGSAVTGTTTGVSAVSGSQQAADVQGSTVTGSTTGVSAVSGSGQAPAGTQGSAVTGSTTAVSAVSGTGAVQEGTAQGPVTATTGSGTSTVSGGTPEQGQTGQSVTVGGQTGVSTVSGSGQDVADATGTVVSGGSGTGVGAVSGSTAAQDATGTAVTAAAGGSYGAVRTGMDNGSYTTVGTVAILDTSGTRTTDTYEIIENQTPLAEGIEGTQSSETGLGLFGVIGAAVAAVAAGVAAVAAIVWRKRNPKAGS